MRNVIRNMIRLLLVAVVSLPIVLLLGAGALGNFALGPKSERQP